MANIEHPRPYVWTEENIGKFWSLVEASELSHLGFSHFVAEQLVGVIARTVGKSARILDYGGGSGELTYALLQAGFQVGIYEPYRGGVGGEIMQSVVKYDKFLGVVNPGSPARFDLICAFEVFEHLLPDNAWNDLKILSSFMAEGAVLIGTVPLAESLVSNSCICPSCQTMFHRWQHMRSFNQESLGRFLTDSGFMQHKTFVIEFAVSRLGFLASRGPAPLDAPEFILDAPFTEEELFARLHRKLAESNAVIANLGSNVGALNYQVHLMLHELSLAYARLLAPHPGPGEGEGLALDNALAEAWKKRDEHYREIVPYNEQLVTERKRLTEFSGQLAAERKVIAECLQKLGDVALQSQFAKQKIVELKAKLETTIQEQQNQEKEFARHHANNGFNLAALKTSNAELRDQAKHGAGRITELGGQVEALQTAKAELEVQAKHEAGRIAELGGQVEALQTAKAELEVQAKHEAGRITELGGQVEALQTAKVELEVQAKHEAGHIAELGGQVEALQTAKVELEVQAKHEAGHIAELGGQVEALQTAKAELENQAKHDARHIAELGGQVEALQTAKTEVDNKIHQDARRILEHENTIAEVREKHANSLVTISALTPYKDLGDCLGLRNLQTLAACGFVSRKMAAAARLVGKIPLAKRTYRAMGRMRGKLRKPARETVPQADVCRIFTSDQLLKPDFTLFPAAHPASKEAGAGKPAVCFVTSHMGPGGAERQMANLAVCLRHMGLAVRVRVYSLEGDGSHYVSLLEKHDIDVKQIAPMKSAVFMKRHNFTGELLDFLPPSEIGCVLSLADELIHTPVDVLHSYLDQPNIISAWAGMLSGTPVIRLSWRNLNPSNFFFYQPWMPVQYGYFTSEPRIGFEANARESAQDYAKWLGIDAEAVTYSPNGIAPDWMGKLPPRARQNIRKSLSIPHDAPVVLTACRLSGEKLPLDMVAVFARILRAFPKAHCIHVGVGQMETEVADAVATLETAVRGRIHLLGRRTDMPAIYSASDALLLCSRAEGMPNVVMEAMLMGLPVVATKVGGSVDLVSPGETGFLAEPGDVDGLSAAVIKVLGDKSLGVSMSNAAKQRIKPFSMEELATRSVACYLRALQG